ncbi:glycosyltransferase [Microbacterium sp.]|uniref:glycosyltransferase n=1 Tax=Microbacterium sp. TaxID=51671 RepID=UPI003A882C76
MRETTVAVVTALSPSATTLAEYGLHFLRALGRRRGIRVIALVEDLDLDYPDIDGVEIVRCWRFDSPATPVRILRAARHRRADVVLINAHFTSFGSSKVAAALGLCSPALLRAAGIPVVTLLHNLVDTVDLGAAGFGGSPLRERLLRAAGRLVTRIVLRSTLVTTTMPGYVDILRQRYGARNVAWTPHGTFDAPMPPCASPTVPVVLAFGKFGTYKRVEGLIAAVRSLGRPDVTVVVAGTDSPNATGYLADVERRMGGSDVEFTGYVAEDDVERLFRGARLTVFPYEATTGSSGVLHQAAGFGCAPVVPRVGDLERLVADEGLTGVFFEPGDVDDMARAITRLLDDESERARIVQHNYDAAVGLTMDMVMDLFLVHLAEAATGDPRALLSSVVEWQPTAVLWP